MGRTAVKTFFATTALAVAIATAGIAQAADGANTAVRSMVGNVCSKCHGETGVSTLPLFPILAHQQKQYLINQLTAFRDHGRADPHAEAYMWGIAGPLGNDTIDGLATYFSEQKAAAGRPAEDAAMVAEGRKLFQHGDLAKGIPACADCHGKKAEGNGEFPRLAGQHQNYIVTQLLAFRGLLRKNVLMDANAKDLTDQDARAIAAYLSTL
jgi:cytochrome c553